MTTKSDQTIGGRFQSKTISIDRSLLRRAKVHCAEHDRSFSRFVTEAIETALTNHKPRTKITA